MMESISSSPLAEKVTFFKQLRANLLEHNDEDAFDNNEIQYRVQCRQFFRMMPSSSIDLKAASSSGFDGRTSPEKDMEQQTLANAQPATGYAATGNSVILATPTTANRPKARFLKIQSKTYEVIDLEDEVIPATTQSKAKAKLRASSTATHSNTLSPLDSTLKRPRAAVGTDSSSTRISASKRRKRDASPELRPEAEQILSGLSFYYVPDNDIAPARRLRIRKAREYGAVWLRSMSGATHMVVEKSIQYKDIEKLVSDAERMGQTLTVVNEDYPIDCIQFKTILETSQKKYKLVGQPAAQSMAATPGPAPASPSRQPLKLKSPQKTPRRWDFAPPPSTPSRSEESPSQASRIAGTPPQPLPAGLGTTVPAAEAATAAKTRSHRGSASSFTVRDHQLQTMSNNVNRNLEGNTDSPSDELSQYIAVMQEFKDLPLDIDDENEAQSREGSIEKDSLEQKASPERERLARKQSTRSLPSRKDIRFEDRFACNSAGAKDTNAGNPNSRTIEVLQSMANYYDRVNDQWRTVAYRKAIATLKRQQARINTEEEAIRLPSIGQRLAEKIEEIVTTDRLRRLEYAQTEPMDEALQLFLRIYGVGSKQAHQWTAQGYRTLDDLREKAKLTANQKIGIEHYDDLNEIIPRHEVEALGKFVTKSAADVDPSLKLIIGGSYRRGAESSHDIDFIVTKPNTGSTAEILPSLGKLIRQLEEQGFLVARLASSRSASSDGSKWHGCCVLPLIKGVNDGDDYRPTWRRIDFLVVPESEIGAALIYFTGNDIFNRSMRLLASKKGMRLNQRGLYKDAMRGPDRARVTEVDLLEGRNERRIFEILGVQWREPHERWC
jgi:DNA polymerase IV